MRHLFRRVGALARWLLPGHDSLLTIERSTIRCVERLDPAQIESLVRRVSRSGG